MTVALSLIALVLSVATYVGYRGLWDKADLSEFTTTLERLERVIDRIEQTAHVVASDMTEAREHSDVLAADLAVAKTAVELVASELASAQGRADTITNGHPGEAADAGAQSAKNS